VLLETFPPPDSRDAKLVSRFLSKGEPSVLTDRVMQEGRAREKERERERERD
jgi:hypothetical protein